MSDTYKFNGFETPEQNWFKTPNSLIDALPAIETISEMKVIFYILRHTWGYHEYDTPKPITIDEFMKGRKRKDGTRIDGGTGLSKPSVIDGLRKAEDHGFIVSIKDESDAARIEKAYLPAMSNEIQMSKDLTADVKSFDIGGKESLHRTEKDTKRKTPKKKILSADSGESSKARPRDVIFDAVAKGSWNISDTTKLEKRSSGRIGMVSSWIKKQYPDCTPDMIAQFYRDYDRATKGTPRPRTMETFCPRFTAWYERQQAPAPATIKYTAPSEPIPDYGDDFIVLDENGMYVGRGQAAWLAYYGEKS